MNRPRTYGRGSGPLILAADQRLVENFVEKFGKKWKKMENYS